MSKAMTLREREKELRAQLLAPGGGAELEKLAAAYADSGAGRRIGKSLITYILVHERVRGIIHL